MTENQSISYVTTMSSNDENVGNRLVFCHFMASYIFIALSNYKTGVGVRVGADI
jgi:hypothetical protein